MLYLESDGVIKLTRGDTARFTVVVDEVDADGNVVGVYQFDPDDKIIFGVKRNLKEDRYYLKKVVIGENQIVIEPSDTKDLQFGKYKYDVQLEKANGDVYTITDTSTFEILTEVC